MVKNENLIVKFIYVDEKAHKHKMLSLKNKKLKWEWNFSVDDIKKATSNLDRKYNELTLNDSAGKHRNIYMW